MYITKADLKKYGSTQGCAACAAIKGGINRSGILHNQECRARIEKAMQEDPGDQGRLKEQEEKETEKLARELEEGDKKARKAAEEAERKKERARSSARPRGRV